LNVQRHRPTEAFAPWRWTPGVRRSLEDLRHAAFLRYSFSNVTKPSSSSSQRLKVGDLTPELKHVAKLGAAEQAHTYIFMTSMSVDAPVAAELRSRLRVLGVGATEMSARAEVDGREAHWRLPPSQARFVKNLGGTINFPSHKRPGVRSWMPHCCGEEGGRNPTVKLPAFFVRRMTCRLWFNVWLLPPSGRRATRVNKLGRDKRCD